MRQKINIATITAISTTIFIVFLIWLTEVLLNHFFIDHTFNANLARWAFICIVLFLFLFTGALFLINEQAKLQIESIYKLLPELQTNFKQKYTLEKLSEDISNIALDKSQEIDILNEREDYRREFVGNVAHELKTPLFSIQGYLLTLIEGGVNDENIRDKYLSRINKSVERLTYIVKDLDLITELESGNLKLDIYPFNIVALIKEVYDLLEIEAKNNNVILKMDKRYESPIKVVGDIERIEQVLTNLVANAINHSQRDSVVTTSILVQKDRVKVSIQDTGIGIPKEQLSRIFERFYRADKSRSRQQGGSGLGLSIVKHILEAHHQKIMVESDYGNGAKFSFYLDRSSKI